MTARRSALITGASGGLGSAIARRLAAQGTTLTLVARDGGRLDALEIDGQRLALDLRLPANCAAAVDAARTHGSGLDIVVNAVGVVAFGPAAHLDTDTMEELFLTNTFAAIELTKAALAVMNDGGVIVNLSGQVAEQAFPNMGAYTASKAAVRAFDEVAAKEARRRKIRVIDARPPHTETGLADRPLAGAAPKMPRGLDPDFVARVIADAIDGDATDLPTSAFG